jgi:hypothetical protein
VQTTQSVSMDAPVSPLTAPIWLRSDLLEGGHSDRDVAALVRTGALHRLRRGAFVEGTTYDAASPEQRHGLLVRAVVRQARTSVLPSHHSALPFLDAPMWGVPFDRVHVTRPDHRAGRAAAGVRQHQGSLTQGDVSVIHGLEVTSATRTALDVTTTCTTEVSLAVVNDLLHRGLTTLAALRDRYATMVTNPHTLKTDLVLRLADPRLESVAESRTYLMLFRGGVPAPEPQFPVLDETGYEFARLDFAWPKLGAWLEFDGREKYLRHRRAGESVTDAVLREKCRESRISELTGWRCIRITWADLERPNHTLSRILRVLGVAPRVTSLSL